MNTTVLTDEIQKEQMENPGSQLALIREQRGYSREYVAGKLHLRVRLIELLEDDKYDQMPQAVFVMGYFRAYAKLLGVAPEPFLEKFASTCVVERKTEKAALRQVKKEVNRNERSVRWVSGIIVVGAIVAATLWWQKNNDGQLFFTAKSESKQVTNAATDKEEKPVELTEVSKMKSFFKSTPQQSVVEN